MLFEHTCKHCAKVTFLYPAQFNHPRTGPRLYCSRVCKDDANAKNKYTPCKCCGGPTKERKNIYCSRSCRATYEKWITKNG
jgi:hypothetical protein